MRTAASFGLVALIALAFTAAPGGGRTLTVIFTVMWIAFLVLLAFAGYTFYRRHRFDIDSLSERQRVVLYGSIGVAFLAFCATGRLVEAGGLGFLAWLAVLALCSYGLYWVWTQYRSYG